MRGRRSAPQVLINGQKAQKPESSKINGNGGNEEEPAIMEEILDGRYLEITEELEFFCKFRDSKKPRWVPRSQCTNGYLIQDFFERRKEQMLLEDAQAAAAAEANNQDKPSTSDSKPDETKETTLVNVGRCTTVVQADESQLSTPSSNEDDELECVAMKNSLDGFNYTFCHKNAKEKTVQIPANQLSSQSNKGYMQQALSFALNRVFNASVEFRDTGIVVHSSDKQQNFTAESLFGQQEEDQPGTSASSAPKQQIEASSSKSAELKISTSPDKKEDASTSKSNEEKVQPRRSRNSLESSIKSPAKMSEVPTEAKNEDKIQTRRSRTASDSPVKTPAKLLEVPTEAKNEEPSQSRKRRSSHESSIKSLTKLLEVPTDAKNEEQVQTRRRRTSNDPPAKLLEVPTEAKNEEQVRTRRSRTLSDSPMKTPVKSPNNQQIEAKHEEQAQTRPSRSPLKASVDPQIDVPSPTEKPKEDVPLPVVTETSTPTEQAPKKRGRKPKSLLATETTSLNQQPSTSGIILPKRTSGRISQPNSLTGDISASSTKKIEDQAIITKEAESSKDFEEPKPTKIPKLAEPAKEPAKTEVSVTTPPKIRLQRDLNLKTAFTPIKKRLKLMSVGPSKLLKKRRRGRPKMTDLNGTSVEVEEPQSSSSSNVWQRKRGRPPKLTLTESIKKPESIDEQADQKVRAASEIPLPSASNQPSNTLPKQRGRPSKTSEKFLQRLKDRASLLSSIKKDEISPTSSSILPKQRGRPPKTSNQSLQEPINRLSVPLNSTQEDSPSTSSSIIPKQRGRPLKLALTEPDKDDTQSTTSSNSQKPRRGRPPKISMDLSPSRVSQTSKLDKNDSQSTTSSVLPQKPPKLRLPEFASKNDSQSTTSSALPQRGRPPKLKPEEELASKEPKTSTPFKTFKKMGRPSLPGTSSLLTSKLDQPRKRGRPRLTPEAPTTSAQEPT